MQLFFLIFLKKNAFLVKTVAIQAKKMLTVKQFEIYLPLNKLVKDGTMSLLRPDKENDRKFYRQMSVLAVIPTLLIVSPIVGFFVGDWLDNKFDTAPVFVIIWVILGFASAGREIFRLAKKSGVMKDDNED